MDVSGVDLISEINQMEKYQHFDSTKPSNNPNEITTKKSQKMIFWIFSIRSLSMTRWGTKKYKPKKKTPEMNVSELDLICKKKTDEKKTFSWRNKKKLLLTNLLNKLCSRI